jgi:outer membrane immunogenic protein
MRFLFCGLLLAAAASPALAGDFDNSWLRGSSEPAADPPNYARWSGFYGGGQASADFHGASFANDGNAALSTIKGSDAIVAAVPMQSLSALDSLTTTSPGFGGFVGYNYQIDDIVLGLELNFSQAGATASATKSQAATQTQLLDGAISLNGATTPTSSTIIYYSPNGLTESNTVTAKLLDYGNARLRAGWAFENFLPYVTVGLAVSRIDTTQTVSVHYTGTSTTYLTNTAVTPNTTTSTFNPNVNVNYATSQTTSGKYYFGFSAGFGVDYALTSHVFLRGEIEYLQLGTPSNVTMNTASARVGAGLKF